MAIPSQTEMFQFVLESMADYPQFSRRQANNAVCEKLNLSMEEQNQKTSSGAAVYESRTGWAVKRGAFITTSYFSKGAIEFAKSYPHSDIVLIDGRKLTELMIKYDLGVSVERDIYIKRIDSDYFEQ